MSPEPFSMRLRGARILRDGVLTQRTVAIEGSRISAGPFPAVDLEGYLVLPGLIDLGHEPSDNVPPEALRQKAARAGVTTGWVSLRPGAQDDQRLAGFAPRRGPDLRTRLLCERLSDTGAEAIIERVRRFDLDLVLFFDRADEEAERGAPAPRMQDWREGRAAPRRLCRMAEAFDALGVVYGSLGDPDGEARETSSMLGARLCDMPSSYAAASVAQAVGDPVVMEAEAALPGWTGPVSALPLLKAGRCQALRSGTRYETLIDAAFALAEGDPEGLAAPWRLISEVPAQIMRLHDRGVIAPGQRADLVVIDPLSQKVAGTLVGGRPVWLDAALSRRFEAAAAPIPFMPAAE